jgi:hypothetical protein
MALKIRFFYGSLPNFIPGFILYPIARQCLKYSTFESLLHVHVSIVQSLSSFYSWFK